MIQKIEYLFNKKGYPAPFFKESISLDSLTTFLKKDNIKAIV